MHNSGIPFTIDRKTNLEVVNPEEPQYFIVGLEIKFHLLNDQIDAMSVLF